MRLSNCCPYTHVVMPTRQGHRENIQINRSNSKRTDLRCVTCCQYSFDGRSYASNTVGTQSQNPSSELHRYGDLKEGTASNGGLVDCSVERPILVFSHGNTGMGYQSYFLAEFLASHGYDVNSRPRQNTIFDNDESRKPELILRRPQDISDAYDWLTTQVSSQIVSTLAMDLQSRDILTRWIHRSLDAEDI